MMGYSLLDVDPVKEAALDAARDELSAAEDEWQILEAETDAELARAERMERRRRCSTRPATCWVARWPPRRGGRAPGPAGAGDLPPELVDDCSTASTRPGSRSPASELARDELMLLAEAGSTKPTSAAAREQELRARAGGLGPTSAPTAARGDGGRRAACGGRRP